MSPRDQLENVSYGNLATDAWEYGPANGQMITMVLSVPGGSQLANLAYAYDDFGNLKLQTNHLITTEEQFNYDQLHRLTSRLIAPIAEITPIEPPLNGPSGPSAPVPPDPQPSPFIIPEGVDYSYDALGNILTKSDYGDSYEYDHVKHQICANSGLNSLAEHPGPHAVTQVTAQVKAPSGGTMPFDYRMAYDTNGNLICSEDGNLTVQYDAFNLPTSIQRDFITQTFQYGPDLQRYRQLSQGTETLYIDKLYERKGSTVAITDAAGDIKVQQGFGPFGKARTANWDATDFLPGRNYDSRGFTDHEHLEYTRLIHMNGRAYDFNLGRFLSIDPIIQFPENSQSLNPYSYLMNNPMAGTDPTGYMSCSVDNPSGCAELAEGLEDGGTIDVEQSVTGSRVRTVKVGEISNNGGNVSVSDGNGNQVASTSGTTNTGSGPSGGGQQGIAGLGGPGQAGNQSSSSPSAQGDGVACGAPLQCAGNSTTSQPTANASSIAAGGTERGFLDRAAEFGGNVLDGAVTGFRFAVFDFKEPLGGNFLFEGATLIPIFKAGKFLKFFRGGSAVARSADDIFKAGRTPKASELKKYAEDQGWKPTQTKGGPLKYVDKNGIPRVTIKRGSSRAPGSGNPHVELKDATGQRIDPAGNLVTRKSPSNHTPIDYDL